MENLASVLAELLRDIWQALAPYLVMLAIALALMVWA